MNGGILANAELQENGPPTVPLKAIPYQVLRNIGSKYLLIMYNENNARLSRAL